MTNEDKAFIDAYCMNLAYTSRAQVTDCITRYRAGEHFDTLYYDIQHCTSIIDALLTWNSAIQFAMKQAQHRDALGLALAELYRHARDTESGEAAISAIENALKQEQTA